MGNWQGLLIVYCLLFIVYCLLPLLRFANVLIYLQIIMKGFPEASNVLRRVHAEQLRKVRAEVFDVIKPGDGSNFRNVVFRFYHQLGGLAQTNKADKPDDGLARYRVYFPVQGGTAHPHFSGECFNRKSFIVQMIFYYADTFIQEFAVLYGYFAIVLL